MIGDNPFDTGDMPTDIISYSVDSTPVPHLDEITRDIEETAAIADNVDADIAVDIAACMADCMSGLDECNRCVNGQIEDGITQVQAILDKISDRVTRPIQEGICSVIALGTNLGIPITELLPETASEDAPPAAIPTINPPVSVQATIPTPAAEQPVPRTVADVPKPVDISQRPSLNKPVDLNTYVQSPGCRETRTKFLPGGFTEVERFTYPNGDWQARGYINGVEYYVYYSVEASDDCHFAAFKVRDDYQQPPDGVIVPPIQPPDQSGGNCPCPPAATGSTATVVPFVGVNICDSDNVSGIMQSMEGYSAPDELKAAVAAAPAAASALSGVKGFLSGKGDSTGISLIGDLITGVAAQLATSLTYRMAKESISGPLGQACNSQAVQDTELTLGFFKLIGSLPGMVPDYVRSTAQYQANYLCPYLLPGVADANVLWNQGIFTDDQWQFVVRANGFCPQWQEKVREALSPVPTIDQIIALDRRQAANPETIQYYLKRVGLRDRADIESFYALSDFIPGPSDLVSFMLRDVFDDKVVKAEHLDDGFTEKFDGQVKDWARAQGMTEDQFKYFWRAHWRYPSPTEMRDWVIRQRPDNRDPKDPYKSVVFTIDDMKRLLEINDYAPARIDNYIAATYRPLTRVDARRAYEMGALDADDLLRAYLDLGYADSKARTLVQFTRLDSDPKRAKRTGSAGQSEILKWYRSSYIGREEAERLLIEAGTKEEYVNKFLRTEELRRSADNKRVAMAALKKRFMSGEFNVSEMSANLTNIGIDHDQIGEIIYNWSVIRDAKYKPATVAQLCEWWQRGLVTMEEFSRRVENLGFSHADASRIIQTCSGKHTERLEKEAEKQAKEAESRERRRIAAAKAAQRDAERAYRAGLPCTPSKPKCKPGTTVPEPQKNGAPAGGG